MRREWAAVAVLLVGLAGFMLMEASGSTEAFSPQFASRPLQGRVIGVDAGHGGYDGGCEGEIAFENFNAASGKVEFTGVNVHPGSAKDKMKNASTIACEFNSMLPPDEVPEKTEGYEGFHHLSSISGGIEKAELRYIIRDHDRTEFEAKKARFAEIADALNKKYGEGTIELSVSDSYYNMKEKIEPNMFIIDRARKAMTDCNVAPKIVPIRGGTDGARLSFMGLPCPNLCTGGENFHSRFEFVSCEAMETISEILASLILNAAEQEKMAL